MVLACGTKGSRRPVPVNVPEARSEPVSHSAPPGGWTFRYSPGTSSYRTTRVASIESREDSGSHREISTNTTYESIVLDPDSASGRVHVIVVADSFATTTQGRIGAVQPVSLPVKVTASLGDSGVVVEAPGEGEKCNSAGSTLASDLRNLLPRFPQGAVSGMSWSDSVRTNGCQAGIPTVFDLRRVFVVSGVMTENSNPVLVVLRTDTISALGEGAQLQHRIALRSEGTGRATYYLDLAAGKVLRLTTGQNLILSFSASGRKGSFLETSQQEFVLLR